MEENDVTTMRERVARIEEKIDYLHGDLKKIGEKVEMLEQKPAKRWDSVIAAILAALGGGVGGAFFTIIIGG